MMNISVGLLTSSMTKAHHGRLVYVSFESNEGQKYSHLQVSNYGFVWFGWSLLFSLALLSTAIIQFCQTAKRLIDINYKGNAVGIVIL